MRKSTAGNLDPNRMQRIKEIILAKFGGERCLENKEALWEKCIIAIGQKCKHQH